MNWFISAVRKYAVFDGRARRKEFWFYELFYFVFFIALAWIDRFTGTFDVRNSVGFLSGLFAIAMFLPSLGVTIRRLHDTDRTGWWLLMVFVPFIGLIWLLVLLVLEGTPGDNRFGRDPVQLPEPE